MSIAIDTVEAMIQEAAQDIDRVEKLCSQHNKDIRTWDNVAIEEMRHETGRRIALLKVVKNRIMAEETKVLESEVRARQS